VQADALRIKKQSDIVWMALVMMVKPASRSSGCVRGFLIRRGSSLGRHGAIRDDGTTKDWQKGDLMAVTMQQISPVAPRPLVLGVARKLQPVLAYAAGAIGDWIEDGVNGRLIELGKPEQFF
jgi:hypothetical protein